MDLCKYGLVVLNGTDVVCHAKVNLLMATGDTPDVDDLMHHGTHASLYGCRFCKEKGRHAENRNHGMCFVSTTAP